MSEKHKKTCKYLNYFEHLLILASVVAGCVSAFAFTSLVAVPVGITSSAAGIKICAITAKIKRYKIVLLAKTKLDTMEVLISKSLIDSFIIHDAFVSANNVLRECNEMNKKS